MNKEIKEKWVAALRSGKYKQGKNYLRKDNDGVSEFCCLGVLCDLIAPDEWEYRSKGVYNHNNFLVSSLPSKIMEISGISHNLGYFMHYVNGFNNLASLNDYNYTFKQIADVIEEQF